MKNHITIYYVFTFFHGTGGDYVNLDHIRTLRKWGLDAQILFLGLNLNQFLQHPPVQGLPVLTHEQLQQRGLSPHDIIITPEVYRFMYDGTINFPNNRIFMHNQNPNQLCDATPSAKEVNQQANLVGIIVPSRYTQRKLREVGITKPSYLISPYLPDYFQPATKSAAPIRIVYSARKRRPETEIVWYYFRSLYNLNIDVEVVNLEGLSRQQVAKEMAQAHIFASFAERESLGLMVFEAMASGCHVVGFSGYTDFENNDFLNGSNGDWVLEGQYQRFAQLLIQAVSDAHTQQPNLKVQAGLRVVSDFFQKSHFEQSLNLAYQAIFATPHHLGHQYTPVMLS